MVCADPAEACRSCLQKIYSPMNTLERFSDRMKAQGNSRIIRKKKRKVSKNVSKNISENNFGKPGKKEKPYETGEKEKNDKIDEKEGKNVGKHCFFSCGGSFGRMRAEEAKIGNRAKGRDNSGDIGGDGGGSRDKWAGKWDEGGLSVCD